MDITRGVFQSAYLGYRIFNRYWGTGYGTEAVKATTQIAFKDLNLHRLEAGIEPKNIRSIKIVKRVGFRNEGLSKSRLFLRNQWVDIALYTLTTEDLKHTWKGTPQLMAHRF
jgi:ribosomal-protein-alanine N-acetyltransferase